MKKIFLILFATCGMISLLVVTGCVKESILSPSETTDALSRKAPNFAGYLITEQKYGTIAGTILPVEANAKVFLSGADPIELLLDDSGKIISKQIAEGEYSINIEPENSEYAYYTVENVTVKSGTVTDIGTIVLDYAYWGGGDGCWAGWGRLTQGK